MQQLSGLDATFLYLETPQMPMHVGALHIFELPTGYKGRFVRDLRRHIAARLPILPALRRRLWWMPLNLANPAWVDAAPDLDRHIVEHRLPASAKKPAGGGLAELEALVGELHPQLLDRSRPLWKFHVLEGRRRVGLYTQLHHAAVDGQAAVALANALLDVTPAGRDLELRPSRRAKVFKLGMTEMLRGALGGEALQVVKIVKELPGALVSIGNAAQQVLAHSGLGERLGLSAGGGGRGKVATAGGKVSNLALAPRTLLNVSVGERRAFAAVTLPLPALKAVAKAQGATLNDAVLMLCSSALRSYLQAHKALPRKSLVAAVPITLREAGNTDADNQASMSLISLGTHLADPAARFAHVRAATAAMKATMGELKSILPTDFPSIGVPWLMEAAASLYGRAKIAERVPQLANVIISNVPGPPVPLYLAGARMLTNYPTSIVVHGSALNITVQSYDQSLDFGLIADADALPDVRALADAVTAAWAQLQSLGAAAAAPVTKAIRRPRVSAPVARPARVR